MNYTCKYAYAHSKLIQMHAVFEYPFISGVEGVGYPAWVLLCPTEAHWVLLLIAYPLGYLTSKVYQGTRN